MRLLSLPLPTVLSGLVAVLVGYASSAAIIWQAALAAGATPAEIAGWMTALGIAMGISTLTLTLWYRAPVLTAWSTPGAALLVTGLQGLSLPDAVGIFIVANALIVLCGVTGLFARLMRIIPHSLAAAMLAGILLRFGLQAFGTLNGEFVMCGGMLLACTVFVPIIMIIIGLIFRIPWLQAVKAGVTVGIGFVGMGLVIVMAIDSLSPPIKVMIERFGLTLHVFDVGAGPASGVGYATAIGAMIIPVIFLLNVGMLVTRLTKTMNVDIYNYWHYAITGTVVQLMTGSLIYGVLGAICHAALSLKMADWTAKRVQNIVGLEGISIPQGYGSSSVPLFVLLDAIYEKIPFMKGRNIDAQEIQKRYGMVGDPVIIGVVLGLIFGLAAGEGFKGCATLMITVAAIMVLFPRMIRLIVEGLMPISDGARKFFQKHFKGREVFIGLDTAVTLGHPTTIAVGLLLIPIMLILASILPGNKVLPLADLPVAPFFICMATVIHRGDLIRTLLSGIIVMITVLLIATQFAPYFTDMALKGGFSFAAENAQITALSVGNMFGWSISELMSLGMIGVVIVVGIVASIILVLRKRELPE
ncbi:benzoate/H(+) symporter BenE family transporter [Salmonella enterica]|nr:benzoate/H(+) symporter BenE family transporter [Salmonella enterica]